MINVDDGVDESGRGRTQDPKANAQYHRKKIWHATSFKTNL